MKLKTLKDISFEQVTDVKPEGYEGNAPFRKRIVKRKVVFCHHLKQIAIERIKKIRKDFEEGTAGQTEDYNFMDLFNLTEKDLK